MQQKSTKQSTNQQLKKTKYYDWPYTTYTAKLLASSSQLIYE